MAVDIAGSVTPTYDAAITVGSDGDATDSAMLVTTALGLANRIEFVKVQFADEPWVSSSYFDDFIQMDKVIVSATTGYIHSGQVWKYLQTSGYNDVVDGTGTYDDAVGTINLQNSAGVREFMARSNDSFPLASVERITIRVDVSGVGATNSFAFGLSANLNLGYGLGDYVRVAVTGSGDWVLSTSDGAESTVTIPTSAPVSNIHQQLDIFQGPVGTWTASFDGGTPVTAVGNIPSAGAGSYAAKIEHDAPVAGQIGVDFIHVRTVSTGRNI